jgi:cytidylate kinase
MKAPKDITHLLASIRACLYAQQQSLQARTPSAAPPSEFVTISRQAGAGGHTLAGRLAERLNANAPSERPWSVWDHELVERAAHEHHLPEALIAHLESYRHSAFDQILAALFPVSGLPDLDQRQLYRRVATTIRGIARAGRAIIVGRGGVYATHDMAGGVHVRLVAPLESRIKHMAELRNVTVQQAASEIHRLDTERDAFHRRFAEAGIRMEDAFTIALNTATADEDTLVNCVVPLIGHTSVVCAVGYRHLEPAEPCRA